MQACTQGVRWLECMAMVRLWLWGLRHRVIPARPLSRTILVALAVPAGPSHNRWVTTNGNRTRGQGPELHMILPARTAPRSLFLARSKPLSLLLGRKTACTAAGSHFPPNSCCASPSAPSLPARANQFFHRIAPNPRALLLGHKAVLTSPEWRHPPHPVHTGGAHALQQTIWSTYFHNHRVF